MFSLTPNEAVNTKRPNRYDLPFYSTEEERRKVLQKRIAANPAYVPKAGNRLINPYQDTYDMIKAESRAELEYYTKSRLWSPKYKPAHFKYMFLLPMGFILGFCVYMQKIQMPKNMMKLKRKIGVRFLENEKKGTFRTWMQETYIDEIYGDIFQTNETDVINTKYPDLVNTNEETLKQNQEFRSKMAYALQEIALEQIYKD